MPKFTIDGEAFDIDPSSLLNTEAMAIYDKTGYGMEELFEQLKKANPWALTAVVWIFCYRRAGRDIAFEDVVFDMAKIETDEDLDEQGEERPDPKTLPPAVAAAAAEAARTPSGTDVTPTSARSRTSSGSPPPKSTR